MSETSTREDTVVHYEDGSVEHTHTDGGDCCSPATSVNVINNAPKKEFLTMPVALLIGMALIAGAIFMKGTGFSGQQTAAANSALLGDADPALLAIQKDDHIIGDPKAPVVLMEWSDTECPFCKRHHDTVKQILSEHNGKIAYVFRHYTLPFHTRAPKEGEAQECAYEQGGDTKFFEFTDKLFEVTPANNGLDPAQLPVVAGQVGLNVDKFNECLASGRMAARVARDQKNGDDVGVTGTPHNIIWEQKSGMNKQLIGAQPLSAFDNLFRKLGV